MRYFVTFRLILPLSEECFKRPRGEAVGWYLQMLGHNVLGHRVNPRTGLPR